MTASMALEAEQYPQQSDHGTYRPGVAARAAWRLAVSRSVPEFLRKPLRRRVRRLFPGPFDVSAEGFDWRLYPATNYCDQVVFGRRRLPEFEDRTTFMETLEPGSVMVDVGANIGTYALDSARRVGARGRVIAIEPNPAMCGRLRFHVAANGLTNITVHQVAIAPEPGTVRLWINQGSNAGNSSLLPQAPDGSPRPLDVSALPLSALLAEEGIQSVDALKIDVEGFEDQAIGPLLDGDPALWPRAIQIETLHRQLWQRDLLADLRAAGYEMVRESHMNAMMRRPA